MSVPTENGQDPVASAEIESPEKPGPPKAGPRMTGEEFVRTAPGLARALAEMAAWPSVDAPEDEDGPAD